jgi:di/tricarboxylate transporter
LPASSPGLCPGGCRFADYVKVSAPLTLLFLIVTLLLSLVVWPF